MPKQPAFSDLVAIANGLPQLCWLPDETGSIYWYDERWLDCAGVVASFTDVIQAGHVGAATARWSRPPRRYRELAGRRRGLALVATDVQE